MQNNIVRSSSGVQQISSLDQLKKITLKMVADTHSPSSSREIINNNFRNFGIIVDVVQKLPLDFLLALKLPDNPKENINYVIKYVKEKGYELVGENTSLFAGKWHIRENETILIGEDYQHIVVGRFLNESQDFIIEGELIIL